MLIANLIYSFNLALYIEIIILSTMEFEYFGLDIMATY